MRAEQRDPTFQRRVLANQQWEEPVPEAKPYDIPKQLVAGTDSIRPPILAQSSHLF